MKPGRQECDYCQPLLESIIRSNQEATDVELKQKGNNLLEQVKKDSYCTDICVSRFFLLNYTNGGRENLTINAPGDNKE